MKRISLTPGRFVLIRLPSSGLVVAQVEGPDPSQKDRFLVRHLGARYSRHLRAIHPVAGSGSPVPPGAIPLGELGAKRGPVLNSKKVV